MLTIFTIMLILYAQKVIILKKFHYYAQNFFPGSLIFFT